MEILYYHLELYVIISDYFVFNFITSLLETKNEYTNIYKRTKPSNPYLLNTELHNTIIRSASGSIFN